MKFFTIIKEHSERLPNKNFLDLGGLPIYKHLLYELRGKEVYLDTDSKKVIKECHEDKNLHHVIAYKRRKKFIDLENSEKFGVSPALLMVENFLNKYVEDDDEIIITPHVTSPFIKMKTIKKAVKKLGDKFDSVCSVTMHKEFAWLKYENGKYSAINFNPDVVEKTQNLPPIIMGNGAFFIFTKKTFIRYNNRLGKNPYYFVLSMPESIEIDYQEDYELAQKYI